MRYHLITYGCQMNQSDSERMTGVLEKLGYISTSKKELADLVIINVCSVRQSAVDRVYGQIKNLRKNFISSGVERPKTKIILTGCLLNRDKKKLKDKVDLILDIKNLSQLPRFLLRQKNVLRQDDYFKIKPIYQKKFSAYVPIMTGCSNFCSYCVVPYVRGKEYSRSVKKIIKEVKNLIKNGCKEIILLGQNVNSYQDSSSLEALVKGGKLITFPLLLKIINNLKGNFWLSFITSHPKDLSDELIEVMAKGKKISPYLHLPVQSGDDQILKKMNRGYTVKHYKNLIKKVRARIPNIVISTDIIVGFPGETKKQFNNSANLMKEMKFDMAYIAQYSPRSQTAASRLKDNVSLIEKKKRWQILTEILKKTALTNNKKLINKTVEVLVEKENYGHTSTFKNVKFIGDQRLIGKFIKVKIIKATSWGLEGKIKEL